MDDSWPSNGHVAYTLQDRDLPAPLLGAEWVLDLKFNAAGELLDHPNLKATIVTALRKGAKLIGTVN